MQDRISNHPNRWVLTPVTGETDTYDFTRADDPTQVGTPLNKATFLPDAVASAIESATGVSGVTLPGEALDAIATRLSAIGAANTIARMASGSYVGAGGDSSTKTKTLTFAFKPRFLIVAKAGTNIIGQTGETGLWIYGLTTMRGNNNVTYNNSNSISWNATSGGAAYRMDASGTTYYYFAVGVDS